MNPPPAPPAAPGIPPPKHGPGARPWSRRLPWIGGGVLVVLVVMGFWPRPIPVELATVTRGDLVVTADDEGRTHVKHRYVVSAPVAGQLRRIDWKAGAPVEAGKTVLAVLETSGADLLDARSRAQAEARIKGAESARDMATAQKERARAAAELAQTELGRARQLREQQALSAQEFDAATLRGRTSAEEARAAEFALQVAEYELAQARTLLLRFQSGGSGDTQALEITSPVSGRILRVYQESARVVSAGFPLMEVGDQTDLEVWVELLSRDGVAVRPGARVLLEQWGGPTPLEARVRLVEPSAFTKISALGVEEQRVYVIADFVDPVGQRPTLGDNYRVEARVVLWEGRQVLQAPVGALFQRGRDWQSFVLDGRTARLRPVQVGRTNGRETEVLGGLREGDRVVLYPGDTVADGRSVRPIVVSAR
jgi:HlyD family secretion protein